MQKYKLYIGGELIAIADEIYKLPFIQNTNYINQSVYHGWVIEGPEHFTLKLYPSENNYKQEEIRVEYNDGTDYFNTCKERHYENNELCIKHGMSMTKYPVQDPFNCDLRKMHNDEEGYVYAENLVNKFIDDMLERISRYTSFGYYLSIEVSISC
jgi:hypothetical protein